MGPKRRRSSPWPLAAASVLLLLTPSSLSQKSRLFALGGFLPLQSLGRWASRLPRVLSSDSGAVQTLTTRNEFLEDQNLKHQMEIRRLSAQLEQALGMKQPVRDQNYRLLQADVIFPTDSSPWRKSLTLGIGSRDGVEKGMLVLFNTHVVGRVSETTSRMSRVLTVTDPAFRAGAVAVPPTYTPGASLPSRRPGVYEGTAGQNAQLRWLSSDAPVEDGSYVVTAEDPPNGVPRGLILGVVTSVNRGRGAFPKVDVEPMLNFRGLEQVMVVVRPPEGRPSASLPGGR
jgi:cell shape-determining protein MreC